MKSLRMLRPFKENRHAVAVFLGTIIQVSYAEDQQFIIVHNMQAIPQKKFKLGYFLGNMKESRNVYCIVKRGSSSSYMHQ
jgi:hypothetical protein